MAQIVRIAQLDRLVVLAAAAIVALAFLVPAPAYLRSAATTDYGEGTIVREADRLRARLPIYANGVEAYRHPVSYPPLFAKLVSLVPAAPRSALPIRAAALGATLLTVALLWAWARRRGIPHALPMAALYLGVPAATVGHFGMPDPLAVLLALAGLLLVAGVRPGRSVLLADAAAAFAFVLAAQLKPSAITLAAGAVLVLLAGDWRRVARLCGALALFGGLSALLWWLTVGSAVWRDLRMVGTGGFALGRAPVALSGIWPALPLIGAQIASLVDSRGPRRDGDATARLLCQVALIAWALAFIAGLKVGSSWRYFLEPWGATVAWLLVLAAAPADTLGPRLRLGLRLGVGWAALWAVVYAIGGWVYLDRKERALARIEPEIARYAGRIHAEEPLIDYRLNGEVSFNAYEVRYLGESGRWDARPIVEAIDRGDYARMIFEFDPCDRSALHWLTRTQGRHDVRYGGAVRQAICRRYVRLARVAPYSVYAPRESAGRAQGEPRERQSGSRAMDFRFDRIAALPKYVLAAVDEQKDELRRQGVDVYDFGLGNPDGVAPPLAVEALVREVARAESHRYQPSRGIAELRAAIARWYATRYDVRIDPDSEAVCSLGSKEAIGHFLLAAISPGDAAIVPDPRYPLHGAGVAIAGGTVVAYPVGPDRDPMADIARAYETAPRKPKLVVVNYPHNPTSACVDGRFYEALVPWAKERGLMILSDLAYADLVFDRERAPSLLQVPGAKDIAVETFTMSKSYNMAGWRVGFMVGNAQMVGALARIKTYMDYGMFRPGQIAAVAALEAGAAVVSEVRRTYRDRAEALVKGLSAAGWPVVMPKGTMFVWAPLPERHKALGSMEFAKRLLGEAAVAVSPGVGFGAAGEGWVRLSLVESLERTRAACARVGDALARI